MFNESPIDDITGKTITNRQEFATLPNDLAIAKMTNEYNEVLLNFSNKVRIDPETQEQQESKRAEKERSINTVYLTLVRELSGKRDLDLNDRKKAILKAKIARHYQLNDHVDHSGIIDAIVESPKFLEREEGGITKLMETHQMKTAQKRAEIIKRKMEMQRPEAGSETFNPYEALFTTVSGNYYLARLLNFPHLEDESVYLNHCVGTSDSYINKMIRGDVEIFSLRKLGDIDPITGKQGEDKPVMTWEFEPKTGIMQQMKKADDDYLEPTDEFYPDAIDALKRLEQTTYQRDNKDIPRRVRKIEPSETENFPVKAGFILTDKREVKLSDFELQPDEFVIKIGEYKITPNTPKPDVVKLLKVVEGIDCQPDQIALSVDEVSPDTRVYIGPLLKNLFKVLPDSIQHIYANNFEGKVYREQITLKAKSGSEYQKQILENGHEFYGEVEHLLKTKEFVTSLKSEQLKLIKLSVAVLGFPNGATFAEIISKANELGLDLCPPEVGPAYRLQYNDQPVNEYVGIGMTPITGADGSPHVFYVGRREFGSYLYTSWADPTGRWDANRFLVFCIRK